MVTETESFAAYPKCRVILLCVSLLTGACGDDEPVKKAGSCNCPPVETVAAPVAKYQAPGKASQRSAPGSFVQPEQMKRMPSQSFSAAPAQQEWGSQGQATFQSEPAWGAQQTYKAPQQTYQTPGYGSVQTPRNTAEKIWSFPDQSPSSTQQFQYDQRPWGPPSGSVQRRQSTTARDAARQPPSPYQWGTPTGGGYYGWGAGDPMASRRVPGIPGMYGRNRFILERSREPAAAAVTAARADC